jgi:hypothetical protein
MHGKVDVSPNSGRSQHFGLWVFHHIASIQKKKEKKNHIASKAHSWGEPPASTTVLSKLDFAKPF